MNIIQQLKDNEKPFGLMSEEMQAKAKEIGFDKNFRLYHSAGWGGTINNEGYSYSKANAYSLRSDYEPEPEIVECGLRERLVNEDFYVHAYLWTDAQTYPINRTPDGYKIIGFKFESGFISASPVKYSMPDTRDRYRAIMAGECETIHATHVLLKRS